jgi:hypothetical protein
LIASGDVDVVGLLLLCVGCHLSCANYTLAKATTDVPKPQAPGTDRLNNDTQQQQQQQQQQ